MANHQTAGVASRLAAGQDASAASVGVDAPAHGVPGRRSRATVFLGSVAWLIGLAVVFVAGDRAASAVLDRVLVKSQLRFAMIYRGGIAPGVLVLGNSRGISSVFSPAAAKALDEPVYNLSFNGISTRIDEILLRDYLDHNAAPRLVMLEITNAIADNSMVNELKTFAGLSHRLELLWGTIHPQAAVTERFTQLFRYDSEIFLRAMYYLHRSDQGWTNGHTISAGLVESAAHENPWKLKLRPENLAAVGRIAALLEARGIALRLYIAPYLPQHAARLANLPAFKDAVESAVGHSVRIWDYSAAIQNTSQFADRIHLNLRGTGSLLSRMQADGFFAGASRPRAEVSASSGERSEVAKLLRGRLPGQCSAPRHEDAVAEPRAPEQMRRDVSGTS